MKKLLAVYGLCLALLFLMPTAVLSAPGVNDVMSEHDGFWAQARQYRNHMSYGGNIGGTGNLTPHGQRVQQEYLEALTETSNRLDLTVNSFVQSLSDQNIQDSMNSSLSPEWTRGGLLQDRTLLDTHEQGALMSSHLGFFDPHTMKNSPTDYFVSPRAEFLSSASQMDSFRFYPDAIEAFQRKMELLTGSKLPLSVIEGSQVNHPLNIESAPVYDSILVSTLFLRNDFLGQMLSRALYLHASRGTKVRIFYARAAVRAFELGDSANGKKDVALLTELNSHPNITVVNSEQKRPGEERVDSLHRVHHAKIFVFVPKSGLFKKAKVIVGSRNLSDHYLYRHLPVRQNYSQINQYDHHFFPSIDLEVEIQSEGLAREVMTQFSNYLHSVNGGKILPSSVVRVAAPRLTAKIKEKYSARSSMIRHFLHVPFMPPFHGGDLTDFFVDLIDSAKTRIDIVTPYYNMNEALVAALQRADARGLEIHVVTNLDMTKEAPMGGSITAANFSGIERTLSYARIHGWKHSHVMLHTKALIVDNSHAYLGSANFNRRSFEHDIENGILIQSPQFASDLRQIVRTHYIPHTVRIRSAEFQTLTKSQLNDLLFRAFPNLF